MFRIETRKRNGQWEIETISMGGPAATFPSWEDAQAAIEHLKSLGAEWAEAQYRIRQD